jgi:hypothetical protein
VVKMGALAPFGCGFGSTGHPSLEACRTPLSVLHSILHVKSGGKVT